MPSINPPRLFARVVALPSSADGDVLLGNLEEELRSEAIPPLGAADPP